MKYLRRYVILVSFLFLSGCAASPHAITERRLLTAGFVQQPAAKQELSSLPPHHIIAQTQGKQTTYVYADPISCRCLYVGDSRAYEKFHYLTALQHEAEQERPTDAMELNGSPLNFMAATSPPPYWYPSYYPYYYPSVFQGMGYYSPSNWYH